jgi:ABC-type protease/lipase transport system fused ATPase/permease subunit
VFGNPVLVVLDEPADLDAPGKAALDQTMTVLKASRTTVILITHRQDALDAVDHILMLEQGKPRVFGKKSKVLGALARKDSKAVSVPAARASARTMPPNWAVRIAPVLEAVRKAWAAIDKKWIRMRRRSP